MLCNKIKTNKRYMVGGSIAGFSSEKVNMLGNYLIHFLAFQPYLGDAVLRAVGMV